MREINEIIVHCAATRPEWMNGRPVNEKIAEIRRWHVNDRGWSDIGYHFICDRNGDIGLGRPVSRVGAHVAGHNTGTIGVCLLGGHGASADDKFSDHFTPEQDAALRDLILDLKAEYPTIKIVSGHNQYANKGCPGFRVEPWLMSAPSAPPATEVPQQGLFAAIINFILSIFGGKK